MSVVVYRGTTAGATCVRVANERSLTIVKNSVDRIRQSMPQGHNEPFEMYFKVLPPLFRDIVNLHRLLEAVAALGVAVRAIVPRDDSVLIKVARVASQDGRIETIREPGPAEAYLIARAVPVTGEDVPMPMSFAVLRNVHEALRASMAECGRLLDDGDLSAFRREFADFARALRTHSDMEDHAVFAYLDALSGGEITREHLPDEHREEERMRVAIDAASEVQNVRDLYGEWRTAFLHHLEHEERIMTAWTAKSGTTPYTRSVAFATHILSKRDSDWEFHLGWTVRHLSHFGSQGQSAAVATRVFVWGLQCASRRDQWATWLPIVRQQCAPTVYDDMVQRCAIDTFDACLPDDSVCRCPLCAPAVKAIEAQPPPAKSATGVAPKAVVVAVEVPRAAAPAVSPAAVQASVCAHCATTFAPGDGDPHGRAQPCSECAKQLSCRTCIKPVLLQSLGEHERRLVCPSCLAALHKVIASQQAKACRHCKTPFVASEQAPQSRASPCSECKLRDACRACTKPVMLESLGETERRLVCAGCLGELKNRVAAIKAK